MKRVAYAGIWCIQLAVIGSALLWGLGLVNRFVPGVFVEQYLVFVLSLCLLQVYIGSFIAKLEGPGRVDWRIWLDAGLASAVLAVAIYLVPTYPDLSFRLPFRPVDGLVVSILIVGLTIEAGRRTMGWGITLIVLVFLAYAKLGHFAPGEFQIREISFERLFLYVGLDANSIIGVSLRVACTVVLPFILFGQLLAKCGGGQFFSDLAMSLMGRYRGGGGKVAVISSALFGTVSGSAVGNVVASGIVTIPVMKANGFHPARAGAIEAVSSTGGQLMPPVMGAAAFLMSEYTGIPYPQLMVAVIVPVVLYYLAIFISIDLTAARDGLHGLDREDTPGTLATLAQGWHFVLPFVVLIGALFWLNARPERAAVYATAFLVIIASIRPYKGRRLGLRELVSGIADAGRGARDIVIVCALAGIIIGVLNRTGLAFDLTLILIVLSGDNFVLLLIITAMVSIVLGMGMPTVGVYVLLATLVAPSMVQMGADLLSAHLFVLYFGLLSMITPPVALAAFAAASIAEASPWRTSVRAVEVAWSAYLLPFLFMATPALLFADGPVWALIAMGQTVIGVYFVTGGVIGHLSGPLAVWQRAAVVVAGLLVLTPTALQPVGWLFTILGLALGIGVFWYARTSHIAAGQDTSTK